MDVLAGGMIFCTYVPSPRPQVREEEAAAKRANASAFRNNASSAATEVSGAVARFAGKHSEGCQGLRERLIDAEMVAKAATMELAEATAFALGKQVGKQVVATGLVVSPFWMEVRLVETLNARKTREKIYCTKYETKDKKIKRNASSHE